MSDQDNKGKAGVGGESGNLEKNLDLELVPENPPVFNRSINPPSIVANPPDSPPFSTFAGQGQNPQFIGPQNYSESDMRGGFLGVSIQHGGANEALVAKFTPEHIGKLLELDDKERARQHTQKLVNAAIAIGGFVTFLVVILLLCIVFLVFNKPEYLQGILGLLVGILSGGTAGFGIGRATAPKAQDQQSARS